MRLALLILAFALFLVAGVSAAGWWIKDANPVAVIAFGLASAVAASLVLERPRNP